MPDVSGYTDISVKEWVNSAKKGNLSEGSLRKAWAGWGSRSPASLFSSHAPRKPLWQAGPLSLAPTAGWYSVLPPPPSIEVPKPLTG